MTITPQFLVTGLPRMRSAWLTALFCAHGVRCVHDGLVAFGSVDGIERAIKCGKVVGLCDPAAACVFPAEAVRWFRDSAIVVIDRDDDDAHGAAQAWVGGELNWPMLRSNRDRFLAVVGSRVLRVSYHALDQEKAVRALFTHCGVTLDGHLFATFNLLRIEQHLGKAKDSIKVA